MSIWFVWDGQRRHGPLSKNEVYRRVVAGEFSLRAWVRAADEHFYRPIIWAFRSWTEAVPRTDNPHFEETRIAAPLMQIPESTDIRQDSEQTKSQFAVSHEHRASVGLQMATGSQQQERVLKQAEFQSENKEVSRKHTFEHSLKDSLKSILSGKLSDLKLFSMSEESTVSNERYEKRNVSDAEESGNTFLADENQLSTMNSRVESPEIDFRRSQEEASPYRDELKNAAESVVPASVINRSAKTIPAEELDVLQVSRSRNQVGRNQLPNIASEGVVSLTDKKQQSKAKVRRVNPTAPRHAKRKKSMWSSLSRAALQTFTDPTLLKVSAASFILTLTALFLGLAFRNQKQNQETGRESQVAVEEEKAGGGRMNSIPDPTITKIREAVAARKENLGGVREKRKKPQSFKKRQVKGMRAKTQMTQKTAASQPKRKEKKLKNGILASKSALSTHLQSDHQGGFIVVGPLQLIQPPPSKCAPCEGRVRLPDGSTLVMRSVVPQPWRELRFQNSFYARGSLVKAKPYFLFLNKVSATPKFQ